MRVFREIPKDKNLFKNPVLTIGNFDGIHIGHQKIIKTLLAKAKEVNGEAIILTFDSHPRKILSPKNPPPIITSANEKIDVLQKHGICNIILLDFTLEIANTTAEEFYTELSEKIGLKEIVIGYDHAFGKNRQGNLEFLKDLEVKSGIKVTRVEEENLKEKPASSTWIREEILKGNVHLVDTLLNRSYSLYGHITKGKGRGKGLGFPTANIIPDDEDKIIPAKGVYAVKVKFLGMEKLGMLNIGYNPTFGNTQKTIEVNILDYSGNIYDEHISVEFHQRLRDEIKFHNKEDLISQLEKDRENVTLFFNR